MYKTHVHVAGENGWLTVCKAEQIVHSIYAHEYCRKMPRAWSGRISVSGGGGVKINHSSSFLGGRGGGGGAMP